MTESVEKAKVAPAKPKVAVKATKLAVAVHRINGTIEPGTPLGLTAAEYKELFDLEAIREPSEAEAALYEKNPESVASIGGNTAGDIEAALG